MSGKRHGLGGEQLTGVLSVVGSKGVRARRRLRTHLHSYKFRIARTAISHSVGRLELIGRLSRDKGCMCAANIEGGSRSTGLDSGEVFERSIVKVSDTVGVIYVGYTINVTGTTYTTVSGVR